MNLAIPKFLGLNPPPQNAGVVRNSGFETMLGFRKVDGDFNFSTSLNFSYNNNKWIDRRVIPILMAGIFRKKDLR